MGRGVSLFLLCVVASAQSPLSVAPQVDAIVDALREESRKHQPEQFTTRSWAQWREKVEPLRVAAVKQVFAVIAKHGPGGEGKSLDIVPACEALLSRPLVPDGAAVFDVAGRILLADPNSPECWHYLELVRTHVASGHAGGEVPWSKLRTWARGLRRADGIDGEAALALDLLRARIAYDMDDKRGARKQAALILESNRGSEVLRLAARQVRSLATLLPAGRDAPGFRLASLDDTREIALEDLRGRCVLLHFWHVEHTDFTLERIIETCNEDIPRSQLAILSIPLGKDADALQALRETAPDLGWPVAASGEVAYQIAAAYGVESLTALFLLSPEGKVLESGEWDVSTAAAEIAEIVDRAAGPPLEGTLRTLAQSTDWRLFRELWHGLVARKRTFFQPELWKTATRLSPRAAWVLLLAAAHEKRDQAPRMSAVDLHGKLALAFYELTRNGKRESFDALLEDAKRLRSDECLAFTDAVYDLGLNGDEVRAALEHIASRSSRNETASMALRALEFSDTTLSPRPLRKLARHKRWQVRLALAEALRAYRNKDSLDTLIQLLGDKRLRVRTRAQKSLELLTGEQHGTSQKQWARWRKAQGEGIRFRPREISRRNPFRKSGHKYAHRGYYGVQVASNQIIFVLDKSESMYYGLFDGVVEETRAHLESAGPTTKFNVIEFDAEPRAWQKALVPAHPANIRDAVTFLQRAKPYGPTNVIDSLRMALGSKELDAIVFLSDGLPNRGTPSDAAGILSALRRENRYDRIAIHTVLLLRGRGFKYDAPRGKDVPPIDDKERARRAAWRKDAHKTPLGSFLKRLADDHDGTFGIGFADSWMPPPGTGTRPSTDK